jgi:hypothetical protein
MRHGYWPALAAGLILFALAGGLMWFWARIRNDVLRYV